MPRRELYRFVREELECQEQLCINRDKPAASLPGLQEVRVSML